MITIEYWDKIVPVAGSTEGLSKKAQELHAFLLEWHAESGTPIEVQDLAHRFGPYHKVLKKRIPPREELAALVDASLAYIAEGA
ncbi:TPA: hypothetical protein SMF87_004544 [Serratia marcescens]|nr:hypothetical protein [Serratia marcescens]